MRKTYLLLTVMLWVILAQTGIALAQSAKTEVPDDSIGSLVLTLDDLENGIESFITEYEGITVLYILPTGWDVGEQGVDKQTGKLMDKVNRYVLVSRSPVVDESDVPDFVFELNIFSYGLLDDMPAGLTEKEQSKFEAEAFMSFLDVQLSDAINAGLHCLSKPADIKPKPYGTGTRPNTLFVPIFYETDGGAKIYTFTSAYAGKVWMLKFLVKEDQVENYGGLIALILNNSFALTKAEFEEYNRLMAEQQAAEKNK